MNSIGIGAAEELEIASLRRDDTIRNPRTIWVDRYDDDLYVRSVNGPGSDWFRGVQDRHEGHVRAGGVNKDVKLVEADDAVNDEIDFATERSTNAMQRALSTASPASRRDPRRQDCCPVPEEAHLDKRRLGNNAWN